MQIKLEKLEKLFVIVVVVATIVMLATIVSQHDIFATMTTENPPFAEEPFGEQKASVPGLVGIITVLLFLLLKLLLEQQQEKGKGRLSRHEMGR